MAPIIKKMFKMSINKTFTVCRISTREVKNSIKIYFNVFDPIEFKTLHRINNVFIIMYWIFIALTYHVFILICGVGIIIKYMFIK